MPEFYLLALASFWLYGCGYMYADGSYRRAQFLPYLFDEKQSQRYKRLQIKDTIVTALYCLGGLAVMILNVMLFRP